MDYLMSCQNADGSWGDPEADDMYCRYHPTWNRYHGLRDYAWRGRRLSFPQFGPLLACEKKQSRAISNRRDSKRLQPTLAIYH